MLILGSRQSASFITAQAVENAANALDTSVGKLSSGRRMIGSFDDAAGTAVSMRMAAAFNRLNATQSNLMNLNSFKTVQEQSLKELGDIIERLGVLKTLASDVTKTTSDIQNYASEYSALAAQARSVNERTFNGVRLFSNSTTDQTLNVPASEDGKETLSITNPSLSASVLVNVICDKLYSVQTGQLEWSDANTAAVAQGGTLAKFTSLDDWTQAQFQLGAALTANPFWIGLKQATGSTQPDAGWAWTSGGSLAQGGYTNWAAGQPDNGGVAEPPTPTESADALAWNQPATVCSTSGHVGDELNSNADGVVTGYVLQYTSSAGATTYQAVNGALTWDQARLAAYGAATTRTAINLGASSTTATSASVTVASSTGLQVGMVVTGAGIPAGATVTAIAGTNVTLSSAATATAAGVNLTADFAANPHLATLKTTTEYADAKAQLEAQGVGANDVLWLGGYQSPSALTEADPSANWHWVPNAAAATVNPATDPSLSFSTVTLHGGEPDNLSSGQLNENVAYMSGPSGSWSDATQKPVQGATTVAGYLLQKDTITGVTIDDINQATQWVAQHRASVGAEISQIETRLDRFASYQGNLENAQSRITDVDVAKETATLTRNKVLLQAAMSAFSQAQNSDKILLQLLG